MARLVPAIHVFSFDRYQKTWMPGTRPGMTGLGQQVNPGASPADKERTASAPKSRRNLLTNRLQPMSIVLQSTIDFSAEFMHKLPALEKTMIDHGLDPSGFVISKDRATPSSVIPFVGPFFYDYAVFVGTESFTVTEPNDMVFLDYFVKLCTAEEEDRPLPKLRRDAVNPVRRFLNWMTQSI